MEKISTLGAAARRELLTAANESLLAETTWETTVNTKRQHARHRTRQIETMGAMALLQHREFTTHSWRRGITSTDSYRLYMVEDGPSGLPNTQTNYLYLPYLDRLDVDVRLLNDGEAPLNDEHWFMTNNPADIDGYWESLQRLQNI